MLIHGAWWSIQSFGGAETIPETQSPPSSFSAEQQQHPEHTRSTVQAPGANPRALLRVQYNFQANSWFPVERVPSGFALLRVLYGKAEAAGQVRFMISLLGSCEKTLPNQAENAEQPVPPRAIHHSLVAHPPRLELNETQLSLWEWRHFPAIGKRKQEIVTLNAAPASLSSAPGSRELGHFCLKRGVPNRSSL